MALPRPCLLLWLAAREGSGGRGPLSALKQGRLLAGCPDCLPCAQLYRLLRATEEECVRNKQLAIPATASSLSESICSQEESSILNSKNGTKGLNFHHAFNTHLSHVPVGEVKNFYFTFH